jgi:glycosyltransferase involved in cell wall biosynthesis
MQQSSPTQQSGSVSPEVSIIVPARNEEASLADCLRSLTAQDGVDYEVIVVDDGSTDRTRKIAETFAGVRVLAAPPLRAGWTGKNNAVVAGAAAARGSWLLFTDADTIHFTGSLVRALAEAKRENADLLSYSPEQIVVTFAERVVMPVVFAELAAQYPPDRVRAGDPAVVAANGQYLMVKRDAYDRAGGHAAVAHEILEDVALARAFRRAGFRVYFRYAADAVQTRMYRDWPQLRDGWTKNLALLFPHPARRATALTLWWLAAWMTVPLPIAAIALFIRIRKANFSPRTTLLATMFGSPIYAYLLLRSSNAHKKGGVQWKGRQYPGARTRNQQPATKN